MSVGLGMRDAAPVKFAEHVIGEVESYDKNTGIARIKVKPAYEDTIRDEMNRSTVSMLSRFSV